MFIRDGFELKKRNALVKGEVWNGSLLPLCSRAILLTAACCPQARCSAVIPWFATELERQQAGASQHPPKKRLQAAAVQRAVPRQLTHYEEALLQWLNLRSEENSGT
jgi:hypothetical protein